MCVHFLKKLKYQNSIVAMSGQCEVFLKSLLFMHINENKTQGNIWQNSPLFRLKWEKSSLKNWTLK